jgi:glutathione S-transferase
LPFKGEGMIQVHYLNNSRAHRVLWLLEELGVLYEIVRYQRNPKTLQAPPELRRIHPLGKSPVITDHGQVFAESGAILDYLVTTYGQGRLAPPPGSPDHWRYVYWLHYAEGSAMPPLLLKLVFARLPAAAPGLLRPLVAAVSRRAQAGFVDPQLALHMSFWEAELAQHPWFAGDDFTAADIQMSYPVAAAAMRGGLDQRRSNAMDWLGRIRARPAFQRAEAAGGPAVLAAS